MKNNRRLTEAERDIETRRGPASCGLVMVRNTDGAVAVVGKAGMVMERCRQHGKQEKNYEENGKLMPAPFTALSQHAQKLFHTVEFVKDFE